MSLRDWVAQYRKPTLTAGDIATPVGNATDQHRRRRNVDKLGYHLVQINRRLGEYYAAREPHQKRKLQQSVRRRAALVSDMGFRLPDDLRDMQKTVSELVRGMA